MQSNKNKSWVKDGEQIAANYLGERVFGKVVESRVKYGGHVQYTVDLDKPVKFRWRSEPTVRVLIDASNVIGENFVMMKYYVMCTCGDAKHSTTEIKLLNCEEDIEGNNVATFECPVMNGIRKSHVYSTDDISKLLFYNVLVV